MYFFQICNQHNAEAPNLEQALHRMAQTEPNLDHDISWLLLPSYWAKMVVALISFLCFANSYDGDFVFDDSEAIINNKVCLSSFPPCTLTEMVIGQEIMRTFDLSRPKIFILVKSFLLIFFFLTSLLCFVLLVFF